MTGLSQWVVGMKFADWASCRNSPELGGGDSPRRLVMALRCTHDDGNKTRHSSPKNVVIEDTLAADLLRSQPSCTACNRAGRRKTHVVVDPSSRSILTKLTRDGSLLSSCAWRCGQRRRRSVTWWCRWPEERICHTARWISPHS